MTNPARFRIVQGDITRLRVDAIVNAANSTLLGGGGVDGAIHRAAGPELLDACKVIGGCSTGQACITPGFLLPARFVIHAVGPVYQNGVASEPEQLASCYRKSLTLARENDCRSIAFPAISCGVYGYPLEAACAIAVETVRTFSTSCGLPEEVIFCCFNAKVSAHYVQLLDVDVELQS